MNAEDLPSSVAWPCARAGSLESARTAGTEAALQAFVELLTIRMLAETLRRPEAVPFTVESAMRLSMLEPMDAEAWIDLYAALDHSGMVELLDLPAEPAQALRTAIAAVGAEGFLDWLERTHASAEPPPSTVDAIAATCRSARGLAASPPWFVREVREAAGGYEIDARRLVGTAWPPVLRIASATAPVVEPGTLVFWDGQGPPLPVPPWLMRWDEAAGQLWTYAGRDPKSGHWRYVARQPALRTPSGTDHEQAELPHGMPPFLAEPTWATPMPGEPRLDPNAQTAALLRHPDPHRATTAMAVERAAVPSATARAEAPPAGARLVLRVVVGPDLLQWTPLDSAAPVVLGRNQGSATFPLHHHQVSRAHTQVRITASPSGGTAGGEVFVKDLGSTNGTQLQGRTLGSGEEARIHPGEVIGIGPVLLRVEWLGPEREARLATIAGLHADDARRDPTTLMLRPTHLIDELPDPIKPSFREGGTADGAPPLWGALLYLDRLAAIHAQHGEKIADRVFRDVGRVLQYEAERPASWVRVGYGELLLPLVGATAEGARAEAERLVAVIGEHPWEHPIERLSVTASIGEKSPSEPAADWLRRLRRQLQDGRTRQGRGRVYPSA